MDLLDQASSNTDLRRAVISGPTHQALREYLAFRHFFRQAYAYVLNWEDMRDLVERLQPTWASVKTEIEAFLDT